MDARPAQEAAEAAEAAVEIWEAPWWAWGFVAALPLAFLALVTPWFSAVSPMDFGDTVSYTAWTHPWFGILGPIYLMLGAGRWWGARRARWAPLSPNDWRWFTVSNVLSTAGDWIPMRFPKRTPRYPAPDEPMRTGALVSLVEGAAALLLLGINRVLFHPTWAVYGLGGGHDQSGDDAVHLAFGGWCLLLATGLFIVFGVVGCCLREPRHTSG